MGLWMLGEIPKEKQWLFEDNYTFEAHSKEKGDEVDGLNYRRGTSDLNKALWLWELFDVNRREKMLDFLNNKVISEENYFEKGYGHLMTVPQIRHYLALLNDIDQKADSLMDENGYVLPDNVEYVRSKLNGLGLIEQWSKKDGVLQDNLYNAIITARVVKQFLEVAAELDREVWLD